VYADITWVGYTGNSVPIEIANDFNVIVKGRDAALQLVQERFKNNEAVYGYQVDDACRNVVAAAGKSDLFIHRTGHNITTELHGPGTNMDNYETKDTRQILPGTSFSIEPGLYAEGGIGMRTEIDVVVHLDGTVHVPTMPIQESILPLLADDWKV
jgi:Xaa-Pro dipeptidase